MGKTVDLYNRESGRLVALFPLDIKENSNILWWCRCCCGRELAVRASSISRGYTKSCGCLSIEANTKHGQRTRYKTSPEYKSWDGLKYRCSQTKDKKKYSVYGGRDIRVCDRWLYSFENFYEDMGPKPEPKNKYSIDRIDNNKGYEPRNCRWATTKEQASNRQYNRFIAYGDQTKTLAQWAKDLGIYEETLRQRLDHGWSVERALTEEVSYHAK